MDKYSGILGSESAEFFEYCSRKIPKSIWLNSLMAKPEIIASDLERKGWRLKRLFHENAFALEGVQKPGSSKEFRDGMFNLQEKAAMVPAIVLGPEENDLVLDAAAAPGNKTLQLACLMSGKGRIVAIDKSAERVKSLRFNVKKFGMSNVIAQRSDLLLAKKEAIFDRILLDAPCSSEGIVRKDYDALADWSQELVERKAGLQKRMIEAAFRLLRKGGTLVYSTCSFAPEENERVVAGLASSGGAELEKISVKGLVTRPGIEEYNGEEYGTEMRKCARIYPQDNDTQQFFVAKVRKMR
ncbi:MAG: RsmB/NOP family class I SAM-dependent RNA methyltransferase [Candidatus Diapherotrites archaeon]|uniref:RsmB/NOP family class I SAM-dependent RNA methyltransferase n=1 Tax=Candidatus Iainarchaeum sp. TaxID=3101447 RepID=A0A8T3YIG1_9ARCH|nr:RsmB/NOP family class I SAM-dependent RNA methyltransferase [Candidatus Diapherotrites archaeon]